MKDIKLKPYDDYEEIKKQADQYIERILFGAAMFENYGMGARMVVFMSCDVLSVLARGSDRAIYVNREYQTVCGHRVEMVMGTGKLYLGLDLI